MTFLFYLENHTFNTTKENMQLSSFGYVQYCPILRTYKDDLRDQI